MLESMFLDTDRNVFYSYGYQEKKILISIIRIFSMNCK